MDYPSGIKAKLEAAIQDTVSERKRYVHSTANFTRKRKLTAEETMRILLSMEGGSLDKELHRLGCRVSASSFVARRKLLSNWDFEYILEYFNRRCGWEDIKTFHGYQVAAVDGSCINIARDPTAAGFVQNSSNPTGYNQLHVTPLYDVINKLYIHAVVEPQPRQDEIGALLFMLQWYDVERSTLIVGGRGFEPYNTFNTLMETPEVDFLIRVKQNHGAMREIRKLPILGSIQASEAIKYLLGIGELLVGRVLRIDGLSMRIQTVNVGPINAECRTCGNHPTILSLSDNIEEYEENGCGFPAM